MTPAPSNTSAVNPAKPGASGQGPAAPLSPITPPSTGPTAPGGAGGGGAAGAPGSNVACTTGQFAAIVAAINNGELDLLKAVEQHTKTPEVVDFANKLMQDHEMLAQQLKTDLDAAKVTPAEGDLSMAVSEGAKLELQALTSKNDKEFDRAFIAAQILGHAKALSVLDALVIPNVQDAQIKGHLTTARTSVQDHLNRALDLQKQIVGACGTEQKKNTAAVSDECDQSGTDMTPPASTAPIQQKPSEKAKTTP